MNFSTVLRLAALPAALLLAGCATKGEPDPRDPLEGYNRGMYQVNDTIDRYTLKPVAQAYDYVMPDVAQTCVHNIFGNLGDVWSAANSLLQGSPRDFINTLGRVLFNSTMGLGGCIDVATMNGANKIPNDFGTTLGVWGLGSGPYIVLPILGPSTLRDTLGTAVDLYARPGPGDIDNVRWRNTLWGVEAVDYRANLLTVTNTVDKTALDPYSFVRDAYLQRRDALLRSKTGEEAPPPKYDDQE